MPLLVAIMLALAASLCPGAALASTSSLLEEGQAHLREKRAVEAAGVLSRCAAAEPEALGCWWELGWARWLQRDWPEVVEVWEQVEARQADWPGLKEHLAEARGHLALQRRLEAARAEAPSTFVSKAPEGATLRMRAVGDVMLGTTFPEGYLPPDDGEGLLDLVAPLLRDADLTFGNLEGPLCDGGKTTKCDPEKPPGSCYAFQQPKRYGPYLVEAGFDVLSTANNHVNDFGTFCRDQTEANLEKLGIAYTGRPGAVATLDVRGLQVAVIGFYSGRGAHDLKDLETARLLVADLAARHDIVVVSFHGGAEGAKATRVPHGTEYYYGENRGNLREFARAVVDAGADLVLGHGPHVLRGIELYQDRIIAYSLGNFATYGRFNLSGNLGIGAILEVVLDREGRFLGGMVISTEQTGRGVPRPDDQLRAVDLVRELNALDFPETGLQVAQDGSLGRPR